MAFAEVVCACCAHRGHVVADTLPRILRCRACRVARMVKVGKTIRSEYIDDGSYDDVVDVERAWALYEAGPLKRQALAPQPCAQRVKPTPKRKPRRGYNKAGKRVLKPRVAEAV